VRDTNTGEVIRQFTNESAVRFAHNINELKGLLHNSSN
jgi:uncharacterized FlaG/YvyC family protein